MALAFILALMTAFGILAILWPLSRARTRAGGSEAAVYRAQLAEIERDIANARIVPAEAQGVRAEVGRRLLAAHDAEAVQSTPATSEAAWRRRLIAILALSLLPAMAVSLHLGLADRGEQTAQAPEQQRIEVLIAQIEAHLAKNPDDGRGWEVVAPVYLQLERFEDAVRARGNALRLLGETASRYAALGEAQVALANGSVTEAAKSSFLEALRTEPANVSAQYFVGLAAEQVGDKQEAARRWAALIAQAPADAGWRQNVQEALARVRENGPSTADVAAADALTPAERDSMIRGMVNQLAARLDRDSRDLDGWMRLVRAYVVLGERDAALRAAENAKRAIGDDAAARKRLDELVAGLGLAG